MSHKNNFLKQIRFVLLRIGLVLAAALLSFPAPARAVAGQADDFQDLQARVAPLRFFEGGKELLDKDKRVYLQRFPQSTAKFIYWQLDLDFAPPQKLVNFVINSTWYGPQGKIIANSTSELCTVQPNWVSYWHSGSWGWNNPGHWQPGVYWVVLHVGDRKVAQGSFEIVADVDDFQNLYARVRPLRFFESGPEEVPVSRRVYRKRFLKSKIKAIGYQLDLEFGPPHKVVNFELNSVWYGPDGKIVQNTTSKRTIKPDWNNSYHGDTFGWASPGHFEPGTYRVVLKVNGRELTQGTFEIVADQASSQGNTADSYFKQGVAHFKQGQYDLAISDFTKVLALNPRDAITYYNRGFVYDNLGRSSQALADYTSALLINPKYTQAYNNRAIIYRKQGQYDLALADYNKILEINPKDETVYLNRGLVYENRGQYDQALADYNEALKINPGFAEAYNNRGLVYDHKGQSDLALADYNKALEINPKYAEVYNNRGAIYVVKRQYGPALSDYDKALEINPRYADAYVGRGLTYARQGQYEPAIGDLSKAVEINPRYASAYNYRGLIYSIKGQTDQAIADYSKALEINPKYADAYYNRGRAYLSKKEADKGREDLLQAQRLGYKVEPELLK